MYQLRGEELSGGSRRHGCFSSTDRMTSFGGGGCAGGENYPLHIVAHTHPPTQRASGLKLGWDK